MRRPSVARTIVTSLIVGPPAGVTGLLLLAFVMELVTTGRVPPNPLGIFNALPLILVFTYILGFVPAIVGSLLMAALVKRGWPFVPRLVAAVPIGAVGSFVGLFWVLFGPNGGTPLWNMMAMLAATGAWAGFVSTVVLELTLPAESPA